MSDDLDTAQHFIYVTQVYFCAMYAVVLWDWIISLPREYRFVWKTHWTPVKMAYLFCRYWVITVVPYLLYCFATDHPLATCQRIYKIPVALAMWNQVGSESVLLIRTYAFFSRNNYVLVFLLSALSGVVAYQLYVDTTQMLLLPFVKPPFDKGPCFPMSKPHSAHLLGFFVAPLLFDTVVTFMTVWKAFNIRRRNGGPNSRLIQTFLREGVFYYILISIANLVNGVFYLQPRQVISAINIPLSVMLGPVLACRLILDLRQRGSETVSHSEGTGIAAFTTKSMTQQDSPYTPPGRNTKGGTSRCGRSRGSVILTTLGSIHPEHMATIDLERDVVEMTDMPFGFGMELGSLSTAVGGDDGEPIPEREGRRSHTRISPAPAYNSLEMGFRPGGLRSPTPSTDEHSTNLGARGDIERGSTNF
ncbi:hypothetical protein D9619_002568 [Psilocybe cf. subviscida]|uniref:DUF6533 domain-containing protein n=1 Tax=Psilocybe cf. subviscida TaxID=2480587 RepID=A0A8H5ETV5_9AGAR|nr:hypothetical protein D9619_002568 [Psilocybe cf. subviscida]